MPSVDELAADDPYDVEAATRAAKKMTSNQLRDRLTAASADASGLKPALVEKWVATAREVAVAKKTKRVTGEDVARVSDAIGWRALAGYVGLDARAALAASNRAGLAAGNALDAAPEWWRACACEHLDFEDPRRDQTQARARAVRARRGRGAALPNARV